MSHMEGQASEYATAAQEAQWIAKAQRGEEVAFTRLVEAYQRPVYNLCYRMLGNPREAEDAAQEVFLRAYLKLETYDPARKFSSWLLSIASHHCIDRLRKRRMKLVSWDELPPWRWLPDAAPQPEEAMLAAEASQEVRDLLDTLAPDYRAAVVLKYWHNLSYEEIARTLDTTVSAIKSKLFRARRMMADAARKRETELAAGNVTLAESPS